MCYTIFEYELHRCGADARVIFSNFTGIFLKVAVFIGLSLSVFFERNYEFLLCLDILNIQL